MKTFPAVATRVQARLGMTRGRGFSTFQAVCSGFYLRAVPWADNMIRGGQARTVLLVGAESMSRLLDWSDPHHLRAVRRRRRGDRAASP